VVHKDHNLRKNTGNIYYRYSTFNTPRSLQNNDWNLSDKVSGYARKWRKMVLRALRAQTESRHFKVEVAISTYFIQAIPTLDSVMRKMALILSKIVIVNAKREHEL